MFLNSDFEIETINSRFISAMLCALVFLPFTKLFAQENPVWGIHTDKKIITVGLKTGAGYWGAGAGGAFFYDAQDSSYHQYTKAEGLSGSAITAGIIDNYGNVWFGCQNGSIDIINPKSNTIKNIYDIAQTEYTKKQINHFHLRGDTLFVSTGFGLSLINTTNFSFIDTYTKIGSLPTATKVLSSFYLGRLFLATEGGIAVQKVGALNLSSPAAWDIYTGTNAASFQSLKKFGYFGDSVIVSTSSGFARFASNHWEPYGATIGAMDIVDFITDADSLYALFIDGVTFSYKNGTANVSGRYAALSPTGFIATEGLSKTLATTGGIKIVKPGSAVQVFYPDGPLANLVYSMNADGYGNLWIATGKDGFGKGLFKYDRKSWSYYSMGNAPFPTNDYVNVSPGADGSIYAGTWGFGLTKITAQGVFTTYNADNSPLLGIPSNPNFVVIGGSSTDSKNNLWVLNYHSADRTTLLVNTTANKWYGFTNPVDNSLTMYYNMVIDGNDTKWFVCTDAQRSGLFYFNENKTFTTTADDYYGYASGSGELAGKSINALAVDKRGELWVGTNLGVYVLNDPGTVLSSSPSARFNLIFSLRQYTVTGIVVDAINRKWIATNQGLLLVSPDGTTLLNYFTTKNSPLLSEQIRGLAFDHINGILYVGTDLGMISAATLALQPKNDLSELQVYPSPVLLDKSAMVTIEGLVKDSEVKVLTLSGKLVKHIITPGGRRALWDCRNEKNEVIASGIYLVVAYDKDGNIIASTKMAAIRK